MNTLDLALIGILVIAMAIGFIQGVLRQLLALLALYVATILGAQYHNVVGRWLFEFLPDWAEPSRNLIAFVIIFLVSITLINYFSHRAYRGSLIGRFGILDQTAGGAVGLVIGWLLILVFLLVLNFALTTHWYGYEDQRRNLAVIHENSVLRPRFLSTSPIVAESVKPWIPAGLPSIFTP